MAKTLKQSRLLNLSLRLSSLFSKLLLMLVLGKNLSNSDFGYYGLITSSLIYCCGFIGLEFHAFGNRALVAKEVAVNKLLTNHICLFAFVCLVFYCFIYFSGFASYVAGEYVVYLLLILFFEYISLEIGRLFNMVEKQVLSSFLLFARTTLWMTPLSIYLILVMDSDSLELRLILSVWLLMTILSVFVGVWYLTKEFGLKVDWKLFDYLWLYSGVKKAFPLFLAAQSTLLLFLVDRLLLKNDMGVEVVGVYVFFFGIINSMVTVLDSSLFVFFIPKAIKRFMDSDLSGLQYSISKLFLSSFCLCLFMTAVSIYLLDYLITFLDKPIYTEYKSAFYILLISFSFRVLSMVYHYALYSIRRDFALLVYSVLSLILFLVSYYILLMWENSLFSVCYSVLIVSVFQFSAKLYSWRKYVK